MDKRKYKSGAEKRKLKQENLDKSKKLPKIDKYFIPKNDQSSSLSPSLQENPEANIIETETSQRETIPLPEIQMQIVNLEEENNSNESENFSFTTVIETGGTSEKSTDLGHYKNELCDDDKRFIISQPANKPKGPYPKDPKQGNRRFSEKYYSSVTQYGVVPRTWLCYSKVLDAAYCVPCWLFSSGSGDNQWRRGLRDWQHISSRIVEHSTAQMHIQSCSIFELWKTNQTVDKELEKKARYEVSFWKQVLERLFRITLALAKSSLAFRGHREKLGSDNLSGNFLTMVELLSHYDPVMKQVVTMPSGSVRYLSKTTQNELIQCYSKFVLEKIISSINLAPFFSLMLDTTQDIAKTDQLSVVIRTVQIIRDLNNIAIGFEIKENFIGFYDLQDQSAKGMSESILGILKDLNIPLSNCVGQGYDGANVMSGAYNGVQAKIKQIQPNAEYIHCADHNLHLVINDAVSGCSEISAYFAVLQDLYSFFGHSIKRWDLLSSFTGESQITLKKLNPTRWSGRIQSVLAVKLRLYDILKALTEIELKSSKKDEIADASSLKKRMSTFEFIFVTIFMFRTLNHINLASKTLQKVDIDLNQVTTVLDRAGEHIATFRDPKSYDNIKSEAIDLATKLSIEPTFQAKRQRKVKKHFDELSSDHRFESSEEFFKINVYYFVIDIIRNQITRRFSAMLAVKQTFEFLEPRYLIVSSTEEILHRCEEFCEKYPKVLSHCFVNQFLMILDLMKHDLKEDMSIRQLFEFIIKNYAFMEADFCEVYTVFLLFFTLPVTVASVERSFSKLKMIKDYMRSTISQQRLRDLSILSIESKMASNLDISNLIDRFANAKVRKRAL